MYSWRLIRRWLSVLARYAIGVAMVVWLVKSDQLNLNKISELNLPIAALALFLSITPLVLSAWRVQLLLRVHQIHVPLGRCIAYNAVGIFYSTILPGGMSGDAVRAYYFWRCSHTQNGTKAELVATLVTDRLIGTLIMLSIGLIAATYSMQSLGISSLYIFLAWASFMAGIGCYLFLCAIPASKWPMKNSRRMEPILSRLARLIEKMDLRGYPFNTLLMALALSVVAHISVILIIYIFSIKLASGLDFGQIMAIAPLGLLVNAIPISPGGLGVGEKGFDILYSLVGGQQGGNAFMLSRIFIFAPALLGAAIAIASLIPRKANVQDPQNLK